MGCGGSSGLSGAKKSCKDLAKGMKNCGVPSVDNFFTEFTK